MMARPTTTESGLLSSCAMPASSEPSADIFSLWWRALRWRRRFGLGSLALGQVAHIGDEEAAALHRAPR